MPVSHDQAQELMDRLRDVTWLGAAARRRIREPLLGDHARFALPVLANIRRLGPLRLTELADLIGIDISVASRHVGTLVEAGLVERRADATDGRATVIHLTPAGEAVLGKIREQQTAWLRSTLADWDDERAALAVDVLTQLSHHMATAVQHQAWASPKEDMA